MNLRWIGGLLGGILVLGCARHEGPVAAPMAVDSALAAYEAMRVDKAVAVGEKIGRNEALLRQWAGTGDTLELYLLGHRAGLHRNAGELDSAVYYSERQVARAGALGDSAALANGHFRLGFYSRMANRYDASLEHYYKAIQVYKAMGDSLNAGKKLLNLANLLNFGGNYQEAEDMAVEGLAYLENLPAGEDNRFVAGLLNALALSSKNRKNYDDALAWYQRALEVESTPLATLNIRNNIGAVYLLQGQPAKARDLLGELLADPVLGGEQNPTDRARVLDNLGLALARLGDPGAEALLQEAYRLRQAQNYKAGLLFSALNLSEFYEPRDPARAREFALQARGLSRELENPDDQLLALARLTRVSEEAKPYALAYQALADSLGGARARARDNFAKVRYETEKNRQNYLLAKQEAAQKTLELRQARTRNLLLGVLLLGVAATGVLLMRLQRNRARRRQLEASYETEARISKKVHDELANDVFNIMNYASGRSLQGEAEREFVLGQLDQVYAKTRNIARNTAEVPADGAFDRRLKELIDGYNDERTRIVLRGLDKIPWQRLSPTGQTTCYRVVQELLVNLKKHSGASLALLEFTRNGRWLEVRYKDNGVGLPPGALQGRSGLANAETRIRATGGTLTLPAENKGGLACSFTLPLN
jgi:signal transduction histidine kinase